MSFILELFERYYESIVSSIRLIQLRSNDVQYHKLFDIYLNEILPEISKTEAIDLPSKLLFQDWIYSTHQIVSSLSSDQPDLTSDKIAYSRLYQLNQNVKMLIEVIHNKHPVGFAVDLLIAISRAKHFYTHIIAIEIIINDYLNDISETSLLKDMANSFLKISHEYLSCNGSSEKLCQKLSSSLQLMNETKLMDLTSKDRCLIIDLNTVMTSLSNQPKVMLHLFSAEIANITVFKEVVNNKFTSTVESTNQSKNIKSEGTDHPESLFLRFFRKANSNDCMKRRSEVSVPGLSFCADNLPLNEKNTSSNSYLSKKNKELVQINNEQSKQLVALNELLEQQKKHQIESNKEKADYKVQLHEFKMEREVLKRQNESLLEKIKKFDGKIKKTKCKLTKSSDTVSQLILLNQYLSSSPDENAEFNDFPVSTTPQINIYPKKIIQKKSTTSTLSRSLIDLQRLKMEDEHLSMGENRSCYKLN